MEDWMKYLVWLGWILAVIGFWFQEALVWIALAELVIGIIMGIFAFKEEIKGLFERAVFYGIAYTIATFIDIAGVLGGFALMQWIATYLGLMAWIYMPAAMLQYIAKVFKEGY